MSERTLADHYGAGWRAGRTAWGHLPLNYATMRMYRKLPDGTYRPIEGVTGAGAAGEVQQDEVIVISSGHENTPQIVITGYEDGALVQIVKPGTHHI